jgi:hypothetical protein
MMETASTSDTSVNIYETTELYNSEDSRKHTHGRDSLKSHLGLNCL